MFTNLETWSWSMQRRNKWIVIGFAGLAITFISVSIFLYIQITDEMRILTQQSLLQIWSNVTSLSFFLELAALVLILVPFIWFGKGRRMAVSKIMSISSLLPILFFSVYENETGFFYPVVSNLLYSSIAVWFGSTFIWLYLKFPSIRTNVTQKFDPRLSGLRGLAAFGVVLFHGTSAPWTSITSVFIVGVPVFLMLSMYLLLRSLDFNANMKHYFLRRIKKNLAYLLRCSHCGFSDLQNSF